MNKIKQIWSNKWVKFGTVSVIYLLVFVMWTGNLWLLIGLPFAILFGLLPWFLNLAAVVLLVKGLLDRPFRWENLIPAGAALLCAGLLKWLF